MTNTPPERAFRGFGAPDRSLPSKCTWIGSRSGSGWIRCGLRDINALRPETRPRPAQRLGADCSARQVLRAAVDAHRFHTRRRCPAGTHRGIGLSLFFHGSGFTGGGEVRLASKASLALTDRGARIHVGSTERSGDAHHARADRGRERWRARTTASTSTGGYREVPDSGPAGGSHVYGRRRTAAVRGGDAPPGSAA